MRSPRHIVGRYAAYDEIASGGMASVHFGLLRAGAGFSRRVAIKRMHRQFAADPNFSTMFRDEARLAARIQHPNVVQTLDVVALDPELFIVLEYVHGESLSRLVQLATERREQVPLSIALAIACGVLRGLEAAHRAKSDLGEPLGIVHRDVSPQNVLVGADGLARILDFGVAKARGNMRTTPQGEVKGKLAYIAPEQLSGKPTGREADIYSLGVVLWELLAGRRLFSATTEAETVANVLGGVSELPSRHRSEVSAELDAIVARALAREPARRFVSAEEMALALERVAPPASTSAVSAWVASLAADLLEARERELTEIERTAAGVLDVADHDARTRGRVSIRWVSAALLLLAVLVAGFWLTRPPGPAASVEAVAARPEPFAAMPVASTTPARTPDAQPAASVVPAAPRARRPAAPRANAAPHKPSCNPPYVVDSRGIHHVKPECL